MQMLIFYTRHKQKLLLILILVVSGIMNNIFAQESNTINCLECHDDLKSGRVVHAVVEDDCSNCHQSTGISHPDGDGKGFELNENMPSLCFMCHTGIEKQNIHMPFQEGQCTDCHMPHSSDNEHLLSEPTTSKVCYQCHEITLPEGSAMHAPVEMGECTSCHDAHQSDYSYFLKTQKPDLCTECHDGIIEQIEARYPHAPAVEDCSNCHNSHGGKTGFLNEEASVLCLNCHEMTGKSNEHQPVKDGECITCHSPHGSDNEKMLTTETTGELCMMCHDVAAEEGEFIHAVVKMGECLQCHDAHQSDNSALLKHNNPRYCTGCHFELLMADRMSVQHPPYQEDCAICHAAHKSTQPKLLVDEANNICFMCHDNVQEQMKHQPIVHRVLYEKSSCVKCHSPHASKELALLKKPEKEMCMDCHSKEIETDYGIIKNMDEYISSKENIHAPVEEGCLSCHGPHADDVPYILNSLFPHINYVPSNTRNFELCFNCHNDELMTAKYGKEATNFVNEDLNLHYVHLEGEKARNCYFCHDVHASDNEHLIVDFTWFGLWRMPLEFESNKKGGTCFTGCHEKRSYGIKSND